MARLYYGLLKDVGVFRNAEEQARQAEADKAAAAKKKADDAEKARQETERRAYASAGIPYNPPKAPSPRGPAPGAPVPTPAPIPGSAAAKARTEGFVETTGAHLADNGARGLRDILAKIRTAGGGVLFVDEVIGFFPIPFVLTLLLLSISVTRLVVWFPSCPDLIDLLYI